MEKEKTKPGKGKERCECGIHTTNEDNICDACK